MMTACLLHRPSGESMTMNTFSRRLRGLLLVGGLLAATAGADWPRFRGPAGAGTAADKDVPVHWAAENILWKTPIPGRGNASPIVSQGRVFLQSSADDGSERELLCLDAITGKMLWTRSAPGKRAPTHKLNSLASCTPAADGEQVYALFWDGAEIALCAYDFKGALNWKRDLGQFKGNHGPGHSPVVHDGLVLLANDQDGSAALVALDAKSGKTTWEKPRKAFRSSYSTPFLVTDKGTSELIVASTGGVTSYEPRTGAQNWHYDWNFTGKVLRTVGSPVVAGDMIIAISGDGSGDRRIAAVRRGGKGDVSATHRAWDSERREFPYVPCPLVHDGRLYTVNDQGFAACYDPKTGERVWSERLLRGALASPVLIDGKVYAIGTDGQVAIFEAGPKFQLLSKNTVGEPVTASPAVADNRLYIRGESHLFCIGKPVK
jgi:outer membrane protein assembly factor BamB